MIDPQKLDKAVLMKEMKERYAEDITDFISFRARASQMKVKAAFGALIGVGGYYIVTTTLDGLDVSNVGLLMTLLKVGSVLLPLMSLVMVGGALYIEKVAENTLKEKAVPAALIAYLKKHGDELDII